MGNGLRSRPTVENCFAETFPEPAVVTPGVELVLVDADLYACASHFLGTPYGTDEWQASILRDVALDLERIDGDLPDAWAPYFRKAAELARELLQLVERDGRGGQLNPDGVDPLLSRCVVAFVGTPGFLDERSPEERVVELSGQRGLDVLPRVKAIVDELYTVDPPLHNFASVASIGQAVSEHLRARHPALSAQAVNAVANWYSFNRK